MEPDELIRRMGQSVPHLPETDWVGRFNPDREQIENALKRSRLASEGLSNKKRRRLERQQGANPERR